MLLAEWPEEALVAYLAHGLARLTPHTVVDDAHAAETPRRRPRARCRVGREEFADGISSVAAPVRDGRGKAIAALHVHGPSYRFPPRGAEQGIAGLVAEAAAATGRELSLGAS